MFIQIHRWSFWDFVRLKASWYGVLYQGVGRNCWCFMSQLVVADLFAFCCRSWPPMSWDLHCWQRRVFFLMGWKLTEKRHEKIHLWQPLDEFWECSIRSNIHILHNGSAWFYLLQETHGWDPDSIGVFLQNWPTDVDRKFVVKPETGVVPTATSCFKGRAK